MSRYVVNDKGERKEKAAPEHLPEHLRVLPGDLVTKEVEVEDRIHREDPPHIVKALASDYIDKAQGKKPHDPHAEPEGPSEKNIRVTQEAVDIRRLSVMRRWAMTQKERIMNHIPSDMSIKHLCFPDVNNNGHYSMHDGNRSACLERVASGDRMQFCQNIKHMKDLHVEIDLASGRLPETIVEKLREKGIKVTSAHEKLMRQQLNINQVVTPDGNPWT